ncbi:ankyrin repeat and SOCS box protein 2-like isoform X1 [Brienomyrus brachyistius]|uniref:ankyrin repeat and SOCS box protein 2-like isoform X1 n=1 Tax=Brienomyrus brachyistius TaxID=42636 RepID=UPI0020B3221F|nr:ankyrin repeat and SOCS box protein 2-like isoform X1 [Brienomyrus brachyistius]
MASEDYSVYSGLTEDELISLAVERSLTDAHVSVDYAGHSKTPIVQMQSRPPIADSISAHPHVAPPADDTPCITLKNARTDPGPGARKCYSFIDSDGQQYAAWRRYDGSMLVTLDPEEPLDPVVKAIKTGAVSTLIEMAKTGICLTKQNKQGWIFLHEAAYRGQTECLKVLLKLDHKVINARTFEDETPLFLAVSFEHIACTQWLLESGADPDISNKEKETPLYIACERQNLDIVQLILKFKGKVNKICQQGYTALHEAVWRDNLEICHALLEAGADISIPNKYGITPLFAAAQGGCVNVLRFLIRHGADVNSQAADGATALYESSKNGHEEVVKILLSRNANANICARGGLLPLHIAAKRGNERIVSMLIPVTSKVLVRHSGISPLHLAAERNRNEVLETLIEAGFDVNAMLSHDRSKMYEDRRSTALYYVICNNNTEAATMLLEAGANPNLDTFNPLLIAVRQGCIRTVTLLIEHGANVNAYIPTHPTSFPAAIMFCMKYLTLLKYLLDNGCDAQSCFHCEYGSGPHPPIKTYHRPRDDIRYNVDVQDYIPVQFCEIISTPSVSRWAGPIIDVLLDYVGNVQLCARLIEHLDSYEDWSVIKEKSILPRPLMQLCRLKILSLLGAERMQLMDSLPIPGRLLKFLRHEERSSQL